MSRVGAILSISQSHHMLTNTAANSLGCNWLFNGKFDNLSLKKMDEFLFHSGFPFHQNVSCCCLLLLLFGVGIYVLSPCFVVWVLVSFLVLQSSC